MPHSKYVFDNMAPIVYQLVTDHFRCVGYTIVDNEQDGYSLELIIKDLSPRHNYVSPDVLLFHSSMRLDLECKLYDLNKKLIAQKCFSFSTLISKARNPIIDGSFLDFEYKKLMRRASAKIEQHFRSVFR